MIDVAEYADVRAITREVLDDVFTPPPAITLVDWAEQHFMLPQTSAAPGRFRCDYIPYLRGILEALGDDSVREVVFAKASQVAGSTIGEIWIAYLMDQEPCGILSVWPSEKKLRAWSRTRLDPMLQDIDVLKQLFERSGRREASDTISAKEFPKGFLHLLTARSTSDLKSYSARIGIAEECDEYDADVKQQGDPLELLRARFRTFWNGKLYVPSTPTLDGHSRIWNALRQSTWHEFWVPCPHCGEFQTLRWRDANDDDLNAGAYRLIFEKDASGELIPGTTQYLCAHCAALIDERYKGAMLRAGEWRPRFPGRYIAGFHINALYSPLCTWDDIARAFLRSHHSPATLKTFVNTFLGLPFREDGQQLGAAFLRLRAEEILDGIDVPHGVGLLTAGCDVQGGRVEAVLWGWCAFEESWALEWERFEGDPGLTKVWEDLDAWLLRPRLHASGAPVMIAACAIDAGYQSDVVHRFCDLRQSRRVFAVVGRSGAGKPLLKAPDPTKFRKSRNAGRPTHVVGVDAGKSLLMSRLQVKAPGPEYVHTSARLDPVFYEQLTAERLVTVYDSGQPERVWRKIHGRNNEVFDDSVYALGALNYCGPKVRARIPDFAKALSEWRAPAASAPQAFNPGGGSAMYGMLSKGVEW